MTVKFRTRAQLNLRPPRSVSRNITPQNGGAAVHWGGPRQSLGAHSRCESIWRSWQNYHMDTHGWVDIAYTAAYCNHGYVLAGRGFRTRTAANGTNSGNQNYYAFAWIGGQGNTITRSALDALDWLILEARKNGGAGNRVRPHTDFTGSQCPGPVLTSYARNWKVPQTAPVQNNTPKENDMPSSWAKAAWDKATGLGLVDGKNPKESLTREQLAVILDRMQLLETGTDVPNWASKSVNDAVNKGIINENTGGRPVRRYDLLVIVERMLNSR